MRVCVCVLHHCSLGRAQRVQTVAMGGRDPWWPLAQLEESHFALRGSTQSPWLGLLLSASGNSSWLRPDASVSADNH